MVVVKPSCLCPAARAVWAKATLRRHLCLDASGDRQREEVEPGDGGVADDGVPDGKGGVGENPG